ncbi:unnamed protein product [Acanthocheilonema viteae]|uniref:Uncharacterized protein n=1 Tax=Acanthocheilonema viteae TaxID=6277 RepID=A0A498S8C2_ACAVI|nr:unnamed protein product [Acanthocheilonema viteae]
MLRDQPEKVMNVLRMEIWMMDEELYETIDHWMLGEMTTGNKDKALSNLYPGPCPRPGEQFLTAFPGGEAKCRSRVMGV